MNFLQTFRNLTPEEQALYDYLKGTFEFKARNLAIYKQAFTHRSFFRHEVKGETESNERLEFLGDAILGAVIADYLYLNFPDQSEGFLTKLRSKIVNRSHLNELSLKLGVHNFVQLSLGEHDKQDTINGNALEALVGAIYVDKGYDFAKAIIIEQILYHHVNIEELQHQTRDFKSILIEWGQKERRAIKFDTEDVPNEDGMLFKAICTVQDLFCSHGTGTSKKRAEQLAAKIAFQHLASADQT